MLEVQSSYYAGGAGTFEFHLNQKNFVRYFLIRISESDKH